MLGDFAELHKIAYLSKGGIVFALLTLRSKMAPN